MEGLAGLTVPGAVFQQAGYSESVCRAEFCLDLLIYRFDGRDTNTQSLVDAPGESDIGQLNMHAQVMFCAFKVSQDAFEGLLVLLARDDLPYEASDAASLDGHLVQMGLQILAYFDKPEDNVANVGRSQSLLGLDQLDQGLCSRERRTMLFDKLEYSLLTFDRTSNTRAKLDALLQRRSRRRCGGEYFCLSSSVKTRAEEFPGGTSYHD